jgi:hypothetical protein
VAGVVGPADDGERAVPRCMSSSSDGSLAAVERDQRRGQARGVVAGVVGHQGPAQPGRHRVSAAEPRDDGVDADPPDLGGDAACGPSPATAPPVHAGRQASTAAVSTPRSGSPDRHVTTERDAAEHRGGAAERGDDRREVGDVVVEVVGCRVSHGRDEPCPRRS